MGEEASMFIAARWVIGKEETVALEIFPEQLGRQGMILGAVLSASIRYPEGSSDRITRFRVAKLHYRPNDSRGYLAEVQCGVLTGRT